MIDETKLASPKRTGLRNLAVLNRGCSINGNAAAMTELRGWHLIPVAEGGSEMFDAIESGRECDVHYRHRCIAQQQLGLLQPYREQELVWCS